MSNTVIRIEGVSKQYRLGKVGTGTLGHDLRRWWHLVRGKEDPYLKIGDENDRTKKGNSEYVWALRDVSFDVQQGDVVGILGRNGAGKSTLLKILSRTTAPTTGSIKAKGRIASLLEVGTGFHPELTGKENIFLNGAILGMTKLEIKSKFDKIVDFSGIEKYIDTPVKRYSSGMYVRLAFAVAAHLEPEILIVDEVLAVGDTEFQKKALGKMKDVSEGEGRTVLFVSHNIAAMKSLCNNGVLLAKGCMEFSGSMHGAIDRYQLDHNNNESMVSVFKRDKIDSPSDISILEAQLSTINGHVKARFDFEEDILLTITYKVDRNLSGSIINFIISDFLQEIYMSFDTDNDEISFRTREVGIYKTCVSIPGRRFKPGSYSISIGSGIANKTAIEQHDRCLKFEIEANEPNYLHASYFKARKGIVPMHVVWDTKKILN